MIFYDSMMINDLPIKNGDSPVRNAFNNFCWPVMPPRCHRCSPS